MRSGLSEERKYSLKYFLFSDTESGLTRFEGGGLTTTKEHHLTKRPPA